MNGWATLVEGVSSLFSELDSIVQGIPGMGCSENMVCSYACQPGYQKTQWPEKAQGVQGQTVGGLHCSGGKLRLTRSDVTSKLCEPGEGGVFVRSEMGDTVSICRTDYPGSESMVIPLAIHPGDDHVPLTNPMNTFFKWKGSATTAQYYINPKGLLPADACQWVSPSRPDCAGNWAPTVLGVGKDPSGITYLSIFPNLPTSNCPPDFDVEIVGDISEPCSVKNGVYSKPNGCTVGIKEGGTATYVIKESS